MIGKRQIDYISKFPFATLYSFYLSSIISNIVLCIFNCGVRPGYILDYHINKYIYYSKAGVLVVVLLSGHFNKHRIITMKVLHGVSILTQGIF